LVICLHYTCCDIKFYGMLPSKASITPRTVLLFTDIPSPGFSKLFLNKPTLCPVTPYFLVEICVILWLTHDLIKKNIHTPDRIYSPGKFSLPLIKFSAPQIQFFVQTHKFLLKPDDISGLLGVLFLESGFRIRYG